MLKEDLLFEIIVSNQCNRRCSYCKIDFENKNISFENIDKFIDFLFHNQEKIDNIKINFFWWEPLLWFEKIVYFLEKSQKINKKINYSIWTNWVLLDKEKLDFFVKNNFNIYLSVDFESKDIFIKNNLKFDFEKVFINFVLEPEKIDFYEKKIRKILNYWFKKINFLPAMWIVWENNDFEKLEKFYKKFNKIENKEVKFYSYFNWFSKEKQFIYDTNWNFYFDLDSLLWIQKQNIEIEKNIRNYIEKKSYIWNIENIKDIFDLIEKNNKNEILKNIFLIAKYQKLTEIYKKIDLIIKKW